VNPVDLARPEIRALRPYSSARMEARAGAVMLNANESPWPPCAGEVNWNRYPEPQPVELVARLAELYGVAHDQVLVGRGSDEGIDLLVRAFCAAGRDAILISPPTFGMYAVCANSQGAGVVEVPLRRDFTLDVDAVLATVTPAVKLVFVCAPNNPTGAAVSRAAILQLAKGLSDRALLVVDEAYVEFADTYRDCGSVTDHLSDHANLVILRTLSKAWALAGVRIGALLADASVVALLRKLMPPYPLPAPCVGIATRALSADGARLTRDRIDVIRRERTRVAAGLAQCACVREVLPSQANFIATRFADAAAAYVALLEAGVVVRDVRRYPTLGDALRISIGTPAQNDRVLDVLHALQPASASLDVASRNRGSA
jgi:histidinol-phosphate aminotransferase